MMTPTELYEIVANDFPTNIYPFYKAILESDLKMQ